MSNVTEARPRFRKSVDSSSVKGAIARIINTDAEASSYVRRTTLLCPGYSFPCACVD